MIGGGPHLNEFLRQIHALPDRQTRHIFATDVGIETNGRSIARHYEGETEDIQIGSFGEGWLTQPGISGDCPNCDDRVATYIHAHAERGVIIMECCVCLTRYDADEAGGRR